MSPFKPLAEQARWRTVYELLRKTPVNAVLTYKDMAHALELDPDEDRHVLQVAMGRAAREFELIDHHAVIAVVNQGYRVVKAEEHYDLARRHQRRSSKELVKGHRKITHVDFAALDPVTRQAFEVVASAFAAQQDFCRRIDVRQRQLAQALASVQRDHNERTERTEDELTELKRRLEALENK